MAKTIFAGKEIKKLPTGNITGLTLLLAVIPRLAKNFLMRDGPGDACNGNGKQEQPDDLKRQGHQEFDAIVADGVWWV